MQNYREKIVDKIGAHNLAWFDLGFNHRHSPCIVKAAQKKGLAQGFCFIISS